MSDKVLDPIIARIAGGAEFDEHTIFAVADACSPPLCANALSPTYGW